MTTFKRLEHRNKAWMLKTTRRETMNRKQRRANRKTTWMAADTPITSEQVLAESDALTVKIRNLLEGRHFHVQAITLAELVGIHLAGYPADMRVTVLQGFINNAIAFCEGAWKYELHGPSGVHPSDAMPETTETRQ